MIRLGNTSNYDFKCGAVTSDTIGVIQGMALGVRG